MSAHEYASPGEVGYLVPKDQFGGPIQHGIGIWVGRVETTGTDDEPSFAQPFSKILHSECQIVVESSDGLTIGSENTHSWFHVPNAVTEDSESHRKLAYLRRGADGASEGNADGAVVSVFLVGLIEHTS